MPNSNNLKLLTKAISNCSFKKMQLKHILCTTSVIKEARIDQKIDRGVENVWKRAN
jgi:hypothetical protein